MAKGDLKSYMTDLLNSKVRPCVLSRSIETKSKTSRGKITEIQDERQIQGKNIRTIGPEPVGVKRDSSRLGLKKQ